MKLIITPFWFFLVSLAVLLGFLLDMASFAKRNFPKALTDIKLSPTYPRILPNFIRTSNQQSSFGSLTQTPATMSSKAFLESVHTRRSHYLLKKESTIDDKKIQDIITETLLHVPSAFNSQTTRVLLLVKEEHDKLWDIVHEVVKGVAPPEQFEKTEQKLKLFKGAYGTVLFFEDRSVVSGYQEKFPIYADEFPTWAKHSSGMHQHTIWTAFAAEGLGGNLQHYNPLINSKVAAEWNVPETWELNSQLVFGTPSAGPKEKTFQDVKERFKVYGA